MWFCFALRCTSGRRVGESISHRNGMRSRAACVRSPTLHLSREPICSASGAQGHSALTNEKAFSFPAKRAEEMGAVDSRKDLHNSSCMHPCPDWSGCQRSRCTGPARRFLTGLSVTFGFSDKFIAGAYGCCWAHTVLALARNPILFTPCARPKLGGSKGWWHGGRVWCAIRKLSS